MMAATKEGSAMQKKYIVRLTDMERATLTEVVKKLKGSSQKVRRAQILLKADADGPAWTDAKIAEAVGCRTKTVENLRERLVTLGFDITLNGMAREQPPRPKLLNGEQEAKVIATRLGPPPKGFANWSLRLLADQVVELEIVPSISHETVRHSQSPSWHDRSSGGWLNLRQRQRPIVELIPQLGKTAGVIEPWIANVISQSIEA
jgi:hypothetical protein